MRKPRILALDIETAPIEARIWSVGEQYVRYGQVVKDWAILSWSAKWVGESEIYQADTAKQKNKYDDRKMLKGIYKLLEESDVILTQNGKRFDIPKLLAKFIQHDFKPLAQKEHIDTRQLAKKFGFTSASLEYLCKILKTKHQKLKHKRFPGEELWDEFIKGNPVAKKDMAKYNKHDVLCLEDVYMKLRPWGIKIDLGKYAKTNTAVCSVCTGDNLAKHGFAFKGQGKFQRYLCHDCGALVRGKENLLKMKKKKALKPGV